MAATAEADGDATLRDFANRSDAFKAEGNEAYKRGDHKIAIKKYGKALSLAQQLDEPPPGKLETTRAATLLANRCMAYLALDDTKAALEDSTAATRAAPDWPKAFFRHGTVLMKIKAYTKAYAAFKRGWHLDTSNVELTKACQQAHLAMTGLDQTLANAAAPAVADDEAASAADGKSAKPTGLLSSEDLAKLRLANHIEKASAREQARKAAAANTTFCASSAAPVAAPSYREEALKRTAQMARGGGGGGGAGAAAEVGGGEESGVAAAAAAVDVADASTAEGGSGGAGDDEASGAVTLAPAPKVSIDRKPAAAVDGRDLLVLSFETPSAASMKDLDLSLSSTEVRLEVQGAQPLDVPLPVEVDDGAAKAKFDKKARVLTVMLPVAP